MPSGSTSRKTRHFSASLSAKSKKPDLGEVASLPHDAARRSPSASPAASRIVPVHVRGQVHLPRTRQRVAAAQSREMDRESPLAPRERVIQDAGAVCRSRTRRGGPRERPRQAAVERSSGKRDLARLAGLERHAEAAPGAPRYAAGAGARAHTSVPVRAHAQLGETFGRAHDPDDGQGVVKLVGENPSGDRSLSETLGRLENAQGGGTAGAARPGARRGASLDRRQRTRSGCSGDPAREGRRRNPPGTGPLRRRLPRSPPEPPALRASSRTARAIAAAKAGDTWGEVTKSPRSPIAAPRA